MNITRKDATITPTGGDEDFPGTFEVVLSAPTKDRDGETLHAEDWKQPLPDHITFDADHGMSVATTVGSGVPTLNDAGELVVEGTFSSLPRAQEVRTLVREGHIRTTSVAFMTEDSEEKDAKPKRELLNGAFVAIPSNREALVMAAKDFLKAGARNSKTDAEHIQAIHDHALALGATPGKSFRKDLDPPENPDPPVDADPKELALAVDAAVDQALALLADVDLTTLPDPVQRAIALVQTADAASDDLLDALGVPDPDEDTTADQAAATDAAKAAEVTAAESAAELQMRVRTLSLSVDTYTD